MSYATKHIARLGIFLLYPLLDNLGERGVAGFVPQDYLSGGLIDNYYVVILIYYLHRETFFDLKVQKY